MIPENSVNLCFDVNACLVFDIRALVMWVFEDCAVVDTAQKTAEAGCNDVRNTRGIVIYDFDF